MFSPLGFLSFLSFYDIILSNIYFEITSFIYKGDDNMSETNKPDNKDNNNYIIIPANNSIKALSDKLKSSSLLSSSALEKFKKSINIKPTNLGINDGFRNTISKLAKQQLSLSSLYFNKSVFESMTNSLSTLAKKLTEMHTTMMNELLKNINPFFKALSKSLEEARKNPHSFLSWYNYYKKLSEYFWIYPFDIEPEKLHSILKNVNSEKEFDKYISRYFSSKKMNQLFLKLEASIPRKHKIMLKQIKIAFESKSFALANDGLMSIIDDLLSFYIYDKGCQKRLGIFEPIIKQLEKEKEDIDSDVLLIMMTNNYINNLYVDIEFNEKIKIETNKKTRRNTYAHGKFYSNKRIDSIMLLNTIYYLLVAQGILKKYKNKLFYKDKIGFYIPTRTEKKQAIEKVKKSILKKKEKKIINNNENMI